MRSRRTRRARLLGHAVPIAAALTAVAMVCSAQRGKWPADPTNAHRRTEIVTDTVRPLSTDVWAFRLSGQQPARIAVDTRLATALECRVLDPAARRVRDTRAEQPCTFAWTPARTGAYRLEIHNTRSTAVPYSIVVTH